MQNDGNFTNQKLLRVVEKIFVAQVNLSPRGALVGLVALKRMYHAHDFFAVAAADQLPVSLLPLVFLPNPLAGFHIL